MTQMGELMGFLEKNGKITQKEAYDLFGIQRLSALIYTLKERGIKFTTETKVGKNRYGNSTHYTVYYLVKE